MQNIFSILWLHLDRKYQEHVEYCMGKVYAFTHRNNGYCTIDVIYWPCIGWNATFVGMDNIKTEKKLIKKKIMLWWYTIEIIIVKRDGKNRKTKVKSGNESRDNNDEYDAKKKLICEFAKPGELVSSVYFSTLKICARRILKPSFLHAIKKIKITFSTNAWPINNVNTTISIISMCECINVSHTIFHMLLIFPVQM